MRTLPWMIVAGLATGCGGGGEGGACATATPLTGTIFGQAFLPSATRALVMSWDFTDTLLVRLRDHPIECSETGGTPQDDFLQLDLFIPKPVQADGVWSLTVGNDGPSSTAIRVSHPDTGVLTQQTSGTEGLLCLTVIDDAHVVGTLEMDLEFVTVHGAFEADICTPP